MYVVALERFDMLPNLDDNTFFKTMSEQAAKYSWYDYFSGKSTSTNQIIPEQQTIYLNNDDDINFTVTNTGIIRDNIFGNDDESDEIDMNNINDPSDGKEVVTRGTRRPR